MRIGWYILFRIGEIYRDMQADLFLCGGEKPGYETGNE